MSNLLDLDEIVPDLNSEQKNFGKKEALFIQIVSKCQPIKSKEDLRQKMEAAGLSYSDFYSTFEFLERIKFMQYQKGTKNSNSSGWCMDPEIIKIINLEYPEQITRFDVIDNLISENNNSSYNTLKKINDFFTRNVFFL